MVNRRTHRGVLLPSVTRVFEPGSGWFFSKSLSFGRAFQKIQHISCGNAHFCAITSKMDGAQLYNTHWNILNISIGRKWNFVTKSMVYWMHLFPG